jgi:phthalate 4,5-dioxygenase
LEIQMLSSKDNQRMNDVEPGSALHEMAKRYWLPFLRSEALEANGAARSVELLGLRFVAFRAASGDVGFFDEQCPHRGASLVLARSGDNALTCIFHGWKFDVAGKCLATPSEANPKFCETVKADAFPVRDAGGVLWVYLGPGEPPVFPEWEFMRLPPEHRRARVGYTDSNWSHNLETLMDSAHIGILHKEPISAEISFSATQLRGVNAPKLSVQETPYGLQAFSRREGAGEDSNVHVRVTEFIAPFGVMNGSQQNEESRLLFMIPINNRRAAFWRIQWDVERTQEYWKKKSEEMGAYSINFGNPDDFLADCVDRTREDFGQDRAAMAEGHWSGFKDLRAEDVAVAESVPVIDRTKEHLGASDLVIARVRQLFLKGLSAFENGGPALGLGPQGDGSGIPYSDLRGSAETIPKTADHVEHHNRTLREARRARLETFLAAQSQR